MDSQPAGKKDRKARLGFENPGFLFYLHPLPSRVRRLEIEPKDIERRRRAPWICLGSNGEGEEIKSREHSGQRASMTYFLAIFGSVRNHGRKFATMISYDYDVLASTYTSSGQSTLMLARFLDLSRYDVLMPSMT
jgi:hypothetical protein